MPVFLYTAQSATGAMKRAQSEAADQNELQEQLKKEGLLLVSATVVDRRASTKLSWLDKFKSVTLVDKIFFTQNLQVMARTGFSIAKALKTLSLQTGNKYFAKIIDQLRQEVETGKTLASVMHNYPKVFSPVFVNMIEAGEVSGQLETVLDRLTIQMKKDHNLLAKVKGALTYPAFILVAMIGIGIVMFIFVVPKITAVFAESGVDLPLITRIIISVSNFASKNILLVLGIPVALAFIFFRLIRTKTGRRLYHRILLRTPIFGKIVKKVNLARFTRTLSSLLKTDIPIVEVFRIISKTLGNVFYQDAMMAISDSVKQGVPITAVIEKYPRLFPPVVTQIINVGEQSGTLDTLSEEIALFYEEDVEETMASLATIIEPIILVIMGVAVAIMAVAIILPMYSLTNAI
ncbi:MAG: type II secretion system F family protein [Patescibacteria group bacterium]